MTPSNIVAVYNEFRKPTQKVTNKPHTSLNTSAKVASNKPIQTEIQFGEQPIATSTSAKVTSNKRPYISPSISIKATSNKIPTQAEIQFGEILNNKRPYISPNAKVLPQNDAAKIIYNMKFNPKEYANGIINQPRFIIPERPIASNFTPKLNYNAESTIGKVPQAKIS